MPRRALPPACCASRCHPTRNAEHKLTIPPRQHCQARARDNIYDARAFGSRLLRQQRHGSQRACATACQFFFFFFFFSNNNATTFVALFPPNVLCAYSFDPCIVWYVDPSLFLSSTLSLCGRHGITRSGSWYTAWTVRTTAIPPQPWPSRRTTSIPATTTTTATATSHAKLQNYSCLTSTDKVGKK